MLSVASTIIAVVNLLFLVYWIRRCARAERRAQSAEAILPVWQIQDTFNAWRDTIVALANEKGFRDDLTDPRGIEAMARYTANLHAEASELWEAARADTLAKPCDKAEKMRAVGLEPLTCEQEEIADIIIRALDTAGVRGIDVDRAIALKHAFNRTRRHRHGKLA